MLPWLRAALPDRVGRAVDLGAGTGRYTTPLADRAGEVLAVDISAQVLDVARAERHRPNVSYQHRSLLEVTPERDGRFDLVVSVNTIHHLRDHDRVLPHVRSLLAPGGTALLADIVAPSPGWASPWWHRRFALREAGRTLARRRSPADALVVLRLRTHPRWLDHVTTNIPLSRQEFHRRYAEAFPGARFTDDIHPIMCAMTWTAPS
ncbi:MAG TPA: class I SAM-dependent methyltransferase [Frankiaceae bacterium]|nr:class I SAM-dependent methyltransferase [Frankiaceae bacterium]